MRTKVLRNDARGDVDKIHGACSIFKCPWYVTKEFKLGIFLIESTI